MRRRRSRTQILAKRRASKMKGPEWRRSSRKDTTILKPRLQVGIRVLEEGVGP
jgi:hypothetical protein